MSSPFGWSSSASGPRTITCSRHNTDYVALCGNDGPVTVTIPLEHRHLLNRLERLRYVTEGAPVSEAQREAEIIELGSLLGRVLANVPTLNAQLGRASGRENVLVHLQLVVWGSELALVPFEVVTAPEGFPGTGLPLLTQGDVPVTLTREVRRARPLPVEWDRRTAHTLRVGRAAGRVASAGARAPQRAPPRARTVDPLETDARTARVGGAATLDGASQRDA